MNKGFQAGVCLALALAAANLRAEIQVVDDAGRSVRLARPAQRIVTLAPHMAETLYAAGAGGNPEWAPPVVRLGYGSFGEFLDSRGGLVLVKDGMAQLRGAAGRVAVPED